MAGTNTLLAAFADRFGAADGVRLFRAPGRVNLIGEHTDYNDGFVLPVAVDKYAFIAARPRDDRLVRVFSVRFPELVEFDLDIPREMVQGHWWNYVEGTARILERLQHRLRGADILIDSDIPIGAGLSSSAALETVIAFSLLSLACIPIDRLAMAQACQRAEHEYAGSNCGIMDQFISANAREGSAILLDCRSLQYEEIRVHTDAYALIVCDTGIKHELALTEYNLRRKECEDAISIISNASVGLEGIRSLRDVTFPNFEVLEGLLPRELQKRARHVISENARTLAAADALRDRDVIRMGKLMAASHASLRNDYEVSCPELNLLIDIAATVPDALGTRMTGGGFGGCTVGFVKRECIEEFRDRMTREYAAQSGRELAIYECEIVGGASEM
ncbi:MAG: galactokinase [Bacteroidota bacterium]|nr:galactokinase [Bacteroidota bacterium]MDP4234628.1 galactokinase [Bacteroidota bacterium]MDP4243773.1 galactokinase [Bacteroidota bacterium]MDP4288989.1 galactokinase [Bacteroidota bacterium]